MIEGHTVLAMIPARGGSKGVPRKNIRDVAGKPLMAWTIEAAVGSKFIDRTVVSTDDEEIARVARTYGGEVPFLRPRELARDDTPGIEPVLHTIDELPGYDYVVLLQPTSPLREVNDIDGCIEYCLSRSAPAGVTVVKSSSHPYFMYTVEQSGLMTPILNQSQFGTSRRQDLPAVYSLNGAVYVADCKWLAKNRTFLTPETVAYLMPDERSLDIDTEFDLLVANVLLGHHVG